MDNLKNPKPQKPVRKKVVTSVLDGVVKRGNTLLSLVTGLLAAVMMIYSGYVIYDSFYTQTNASSAWDLLAYKPEIIEDGAVPLAGGNTLETINKDYRAWLTMYETDIDYPVLQGDNDVFYASHDIYQESSLTGSIYFAAANAPDISDQYNLIYGHHMDNGAMFGALDQFVKETYFYNHREGILVSKYGVYDLRTFAVLKTDAYNELIYNVGTNSVSTILKYVSENALIYDQNEANKANKILALSTCANAETNGRLVVFCTMTKRTMLEINATGYTGVYDTRAHTPGVDVSIKENTKVEYSTDGGLTWSETMPSITNVGTVNVLIRATNPYFGTATQEVSLEVTPAPLTVRANPAVKIYGADDPAFSAQIIGLLDDFQIQYVLQRINGDESVGTYQGVIVPSGAVLQGNYEITYLPANFEITRANTLVVNAVGYTGVFDGQNHYTYAYSNYPDGTTIEYSVDGGQTWTRFPPSIRDVGEITVLVRATNPNFNTATAQATLRVTPAHVYVIAYPGSKPEGEEDPEFTAYIVGVIDGFEITYQIDRINSDEAPGLYEDVIVPYGDLLQGNYEIEFIPADFEILNDVTVVFENEDETDEDTPASENTPSPTPTMDLEDAPVPQSQFMGFFQPKGGSHGWDCWALVNLICLIITIYLFIPLLHLKAKFGRRKLMKKLNEEKYALQNGLYTEPQLLMERQLIEKKVRENRRDQEDALPATKDEFKKAVAQLYYHLKRFTRRSRIGLILELVISVVALVVFILTENMRLPMVLIDRWTLLMVLFLVACWITDVRLLRYRKTKEEKDAEEEREKTKE